MFNLGSDLVLNFELCSLRILCYLVLGIWCLSQDKKRRPNPFFPKTAANALHRISMASP
jgi:hypothetical protein